jgi:putative SOS response-associated peptidase YedK
VRKIKDGEVTCDLSAFLTAKANADVGAYHSKAMPVILTTEAERDLWMSDSLWAEVSPLQRPLPDGALKVSAAAVGRMPWKVRDPGVNGSSRQVGAGASRAADAFRP